MIAPNVQRDQGELLMNARSQRDTPFDYIIVGSGAAGGTLAARLAECGKCVLVLEAGVDPAEESEGQQSLSREIYQVPAYHGAATEDPRVSWGFSVRHYADHAQQQADSKYDARYDPSANGLPGKGGVFYPRASALGGCTTHHAMIVVRPNDCDWNAIAQRTGDPSWRAENMQGYFARIEDCLYYETVEGVLKAVVFLYKAWKRLTGFINPAWQLDPGGHGRHGWLKTSLIHPILIWRIAKADRVFRRVIAGVFLFLVRQKGRLRSLFRSLKMVRFVQLVDPNFGTMRAALSTQLALIPVGTDGKQRCGVRERLLKVSAELPSRLVVRTQTFVKRIVFDRPPGGSTPRAVGVEVDRRSGLYEALHGAPQADPAAAQSVCYFAKEEIIVAGGAFNSPQLLMLSGIGEATHLADVGVQGLRDRDGQVIAPVVNLPGVGKNLQDRYEVSVISETSQAFRTLSDVSFMPGDANDPARDQWYKDGTGLYSTNGGALAFFLSTAHAPADSTGNVNPDLFIFGAPAAFRGYYWGWSRELLRRTKGAPAAQRNLWTWILLKAYTQNPQGTVRLRDDNPFHQPEICFNSFPAKPGVDGDLEALAEGITFVRRLNSNVKPFNSEIQPGPGVQDGSAALKQWIKDEAWGHHACGTCRMGSDAWQADVAGMTDEGAVLDSQFRVHGVSGLRVVDASVFPEIPGYFIVTPVFMVGEKAADLLLASSAWRNAYPHRFEAAEAQAVYERREKARHAPSSAAASVSSQARSELPRDTVGLALSGGGIRSATTCLGVLQALAKRNRLRAIDMMATVSGGGYSASFVGRLFTRITRSVADPVAHVQNVLANLSSGEIWWLRTHANYLAGEGRSDIESNLGAIWRNLLAVHLCIGSLLIAVFALLRVLTDTTLSAAEGLRLSGVELTPWWWVPIVVFAVGVFPAWFAFWLAPRPGAVAAHPLFGLILWLVLLAAAVAAMRIPGGEWLAAVALVSLLLAWFWQELAQLNAFRSSGSAAYRGAMVRNRLTRGLGVMLSLTVVTLLWVALDSLARKAAAEGLMLPLVSGMAGLATIMPLLRFTAMKLGSSKPSDAKVVQMFHTAAAAAIAFSLLAFLLFGYDVIAHTAFNASPQIGFWMTVVTIGIALVLGRASGFLNISSLNSLYASRLARTFLGASSEARVHAEPDEAPPDVHVAHPDDDIFLYKYHPERQGGPLHLISAFINETVDVRSGRAIEEDKGMPFGVGPVGVSVGRRFHALWEQESPDTLSGLEKVQRRLEEPDPERLEHKTSLCPLPAAPDPNAFHVLARDPQRFDTPCVAPEHLRLSQWMAISGAAWTPGGGRSNSLPLSLLLGLFNVRLGYWWDSGVNAGARPGRYPPTFVQRLKSIPATLFRTQATLLNEWRRYFPGPGYRLWYLSDGGHIENCALYELIRRRLGFIILVDGTHDPEYMFDDLSAMVRRARLDFAAQFTWVDPAAGTLTPPNWIRTWLDTSKVGSLYAIKRKAAHAAALARITYDDEPARESWLLVLKASLVSADLPLDVRCYSRQNPSFPNQSTVDQFMTDDQWESYRQLGERIGLGIFR